jgi:ABC-type nitrate/sulfonate/bicarbonate transport system substrate-binding protein
VAADRGYFKEWGLELESIYTSTLTGIQALVAGNVQFSTSGCFNVMLARRGGADLTLIANLQQYNPYILVTRSNFTGPQQLTGKKIAINRLGDSSHLSALAAVREMGIDPGTVNFLQVGSTAERLIALQTGLVDASLLGLTALARSKELGFTTIFNLYERKMPGCESSIAVSEAFQRTNRFTTEAFLRAFVKGNAYVHEGPANQVLAIMAKYMRGTVTDTRVRGAYESVRQRSSKHPTPTREGIVSLLALGSSFEKAWSNWSAEQFYDPSIMEKLKTEGFLDRVYMEVRKEK